MARSSGGNDNVASGATPSHTRPSNPKPATSKPQNPTPRDDPDGYDVMFVDAAFKGSFASRISHSCTPNCQVHTRAGRPGTLPKPPALGGTRRAARSAKPSLFGASLRLPDTLHPLDPLGTPAPPKAVIVSAGGRLSVTLYTLRHVLPGEELTFNYACVTEVRCAPGLLADNACPAWLGSAALVEIPTRSDPTALSSTTPPPPSLPPRTRRSTCRPSASARRATAARASSASPAATRLTRFDREQHGDARARGHHRTPPSTAPRASPGNLFLFFFFTFHPEPIHTPNPPTQGHGGAARLHAPPGHPGARLQRAGDRGGRRAAGAIRPQVPGGAGRGGWDRRGAWAGGL
jgi:hypothetical protein